MRWSEFEQAAPELAAFGRALFEEFTLAYLATVRADGAPRVHPVTITFADGDLYVFLLKGTPKRADLLRNGRYALHSFPRFRGARVEGFVDHEFSCAGTAAPVEDAGVHQAVAAVHNDTLHGEEALFRLDVERAFAKTRGADARAVYTSWRS